LRQPEPSASGARFRTGAAVSDPRSSIEFFSCEARMVIFEFDKDVAYFLNEIVTHTANPDQE
jgi:hypothetical protein